MKVRDWEAFWDSHGPQAWDSQRQQLPYPGKAVTFRTRDRNSPGEDRPVWERCPGCAGQAQTEGKRTVSGPVAPDTAGHFTCFLSLTPHLQEKTEAQRGVAKLATGKAETEPSLADLTTLATTLPAAPLPMPGDCGCHGVG